MHRQTQGQAGFGAKSAYGVADWQALELQLNRTRTILQEILVHLQEVLRNLKMARTGGRASATAGAETGANRFSAHDSWRRPGPSQRPHAGRPQPSQSGAQAGGYGAAGKAGAAGGGAAGGVGAASSERTRAWGRPGHESRSTAGPGASSRTATGAGASSRGTAGAGASFRSTAGPGASFRTAAGAGASSPGTAGAGASSRSATGSERPFAEEARGFAGSQEKARPGAGQAFRERGATGAGAGNDRRETGQRPTAGATAGASARAGATRGAAGFSMDEGRQARAREVARRGGMNLKCAYDILCLDYPCSVDEIKVAYRHMARRFHPDLGGDEEAMKDVNVAYEMAMRFSAGPRRASAAWAV
ncbi:J domain-containing protein [Solidesulfovibrio sp.]|uniref:J domain-containing protein n=1 Tax=Solidesulfovibrio sp. TaxID=2910990 RepID=UPI002B216F10|nr:J domain-containing protein [Solidesulfovibrio sp.]MEA4856362.1 J domain-containing protein [Solidesulfovibrio sp.]